MRSNIYGASVAFLLSVVPAHAGATVSASEKALLQAAMQQSIDSHLVDGRFLYFEADAGAVKDIYPAKPHPMILKMGEHFILCTDFRTVDGSAINVDFFVARDGDAYVVFESVVDNRAAVVELMNAGLATMVD